MKVDFDQFIGIIEDEFDEIAKGSIQRDSLLADFIEINSLNTLVLSIVFESEFNQTIEFEKIKRVENFEDLYALIIQ